MVLIFIIVACFVFLVILSIFVDIYTDSYRFFTISKLQGYYFYAQVHDVRRGLLHIVVRHHLNLQDAVPGLKMVLSNLPEKLQQLIYNSATATEQDRDKAVNDVANYLYDYETDATNKTLKEAQNLVAEYFDNVLTGNAWQRKVESPEGKPRHLFKVDLNGEERELYVGTTKHTDVPEIITAFIGKKKRANTDEWSTVKSEKKLKKFPALQELRDSPDLSEYAKTLANLTRAYLRFVIDNIITP